MDLTIDAGKIGCRREGHDCRGAKRAADAGGYAGNARDTGISAIPGRRRVGADPSPLQRAEKGGNGTSEWDHGADPVRV